MVKSVKTETKVTKTLVEGLHTFKNLATLRVGTSLSYPKHVKILVSRDSIGDMNSWYFTGDELQELIDELTAIKEVMENK